MVFKNPLLAVRDMERSKQFYREVLGLRVTADLGANVVLTGGVSLQTLDSWMGFIGKKEEEIRLGSNNGELYFEEEEFDGFLKRLEGFEISYVHPLLEHSWGQRAVRFYDPDGHVIEVGEPIAMVCRRFLDSGLTMEETAVRMDVPMKFVKNACRAKKDKD